MALSHFTVEICPNCGEEASAVGDPSINKWFCFNCHANGTWEYVIDFVPPPPVEPAA